ncbi:hypothetical protein GGF31_001154 [Allomyces arbusculus]|nr:hypothetical protein GGF31_001154 [Allomyces arbusculus]
MASFPLSSLANSSSSGLTSSTTRLLPANTSSNPSSPPRSGSATTTSNYPANGKPTRPTSGLVSSLALPSILDSSTPQQQQPRAPSGPSPHAMSAAPAVAPAAAPGGPAGPAPNGASSPAPNGAPAASAAPAAPGTTSPDAPGAPMRRRTMQQNPAAIAASRASMAGIPVTGTRPVFVLNAWKQYLFVAKPTVPASEGAYMFVDKMAPMRTVFSLLKYAPGQAPVVVLNVESGLKVLLRFGSPPRYVGTEQDGVLKVVTTPNSFCVWTMQAFEGGFFSLTHPTKQLLVVQDGKLALGPADAGWEKMFTVEPVPTARPPVPPPPMMAAPPPAMQRAIGAIDPARQPLLSSTASIGPASVVASSTVVNGTPMPPRPPGFGAPGSSVGIGGSMVGTPAPPTPGMMMAPPLMGGLAMGMTGGAGPAAAAAPVIKGPARAPGAPSANLTQPVGIKDIKDRYLTRSAKAGIPYTFIKLDVQKDPMRVLYFNVHLVTDTKVYQTAAFDLNAGHHQKLALQCADSELYLGVNLSSKQLEESEQVEQATVWEFVKLAHHALAFSLLHVATNQMLTADPKTGALQLVQRGSPAGNKSLLHQAFVLHMPINLVQAVQAQQAPHMPWIAKAMPYISAVGAIGGVVTGAALVANIMKSSAASSAAAAANHPVTPVTPAAGPTATATPTATPTASATPAATPTGSMTAAPTNGDHLVDATGGATAGHFDVDAAARDLGLTDLHDDGWGVGSGSDLATTYETIARGDHGPVDHAGMDELGLAVDGHGHVVGGAFDHGHFE